MCLTEKEIMDLGISYINESLYTVDEGMDYLKERGDFSEGVLRFSEATAYQFAVSTLIIIAKRCGYATTAKKLDVIYQKAIKKTTNLRWMVLDFHDGKY